MFAGARLQFKALQGGVWLAALVLAAWTLSKMPLAGMLESVSALSPGQWLFWIVLNVAIIGVFVLRWLVLTRALGLPLGFFSLLLVRQGGQAVSFLTPGPQFGGEPLQVMWLWKTFSLPGDQALLALALDRFLELWINFAVLLLGVVLVMLNSTLELGAWRRVAVVLLLSIAALTLLGWVLIKQPGRIGTWVRSLAMRWRSKPRLARLDTHWNRMGANLRSLAAAHRPALLAAFALSLLGWLGMIGELRLLLEFLGVSPSFMAFVFVLVAMRLAFLLPMPAGLGTLEAAVFWSFQGLSLPAAAAVGLIALMRLRDAAVLGGGLAALRHLRSSDPALAGVDSGKPSPGGADGTGG